MPRFALAKEKNVFSSTVEIIVDLRYDFLECKLLPRHSRQKNKNKNQSLRKLSSPITAMRVYI